MMSLPPDLDHEKLAEFGLALLWLTAFRDHQVVRGRAKSVILTEARAERAREALARHFALSPA
jgi:hypothetical protein